MREVSRSDIVTEPYAQVISTNILVQSVSNEFLESTILEV